MQCVSPFVLRPRGWFARIHEMRGGNDYDADFASRMKGSGLWADLIKQRFEKTCQRLGLNRHRVELDLGQCWLGGLVPVAL